MNCLRPIRMGRTTTAQGRRQARPVEPANSPDTAEAFHRDSEIGRPTVTPPRPRQPRRPEALGAPQPPSGHTYTLPGGTAGHTEHAAFPRHHPHPQHSPTPSAETPEPPAPADGACGGPQPGWTAKLSGKEPGRRDGRGGGAPAGERASLKDAAAGLPHSPMSVFRHWPEAVSQIRLQSNRHSGDLGARARLPS